MNEQEPKRRMTFEEAREEIAEIARNGEGADKFRALKMVMAEQSSTVTIPDPMTPEEKVERLARVMQPSGPIACQIAYRKAFPSSKREIFERMVRVKPDELSVFAKAEMPSTLKQLYKRFPEIKGPGFPPGFPVRGGLEARAEFCKRKALEILRDREEKKLNDISKEARTDEDGNEAPPLV